MSKTKKDAYCGVEVKLYPNEDQKLALLQNLGCARFVYNFFLDKKRTLWEKKKKSLSYVDCAKVLTKLKKHKDYAWLQDSDSTSLQQSLKNLDTAYQNFFRHGRRFPKFKSKGVHDSFRCVMSLYFDPNERKLKVGKHGWISCRGSLERLTNKKIKSITIKFRAGAYYASCLVERTKKETKELLNLPQGFKHEVCGIDLGVRRPVVAYYGDNKYYKTGINFSAQLLVKENRRKRYQRKLARCTKGSNNRAKTKLKVQKAFQKEANLRNDWQHKVSFKLATENSVIKFEDLSIKNMTKKSQGKTRLNHSMRRLGLAGLVAKTVYKAGFYGSEVQFVDPRNTSKTCPCCGHVAKANRVSQSKFECQECGHIGNADKIAALNIWHKKTLAA